MKLNKQIFKEFKTHNPLLYIPILIDIFFIFIISILLYLSVPLYDKYLITPFLKIQSQFSEGVLLSQNAMQPIYLGLLKILLVALLIYFIFYILFSFFQSINWFMVNYLVLNKENSSKLSFFKKLKQIGFFNYMKKFYLINLASFFMFLIIFFILASIVTKTLVLISIIFYGAFIIISYLTLIFYVKVRNHDYNTSIKEFRRVLRRKFNISFGVYFLFLIIIYFIIKLLSYLSYNNINLALLVLLLMIVIIQFFRIIWVNILE